MSGIHRYENGQVQVHTTLGANGWICTHNQLPFRAIYERGEEVIELEQDNVAFYSIGDRRITNGTWASIVERFAVKNEEERDTKEDVEEMIRSLESTLKDIGYHMIPDAIEMLRRYADTLEG
jgi:hypothetical protein